MRGASLWVGLLVGCSLLLTACPDKPSKPAGVSTMEELAAAGKAPIQLVSASKSIGSVAAGAAIFNATFKNVSDRPVKGFQSTVVLLDGAGKPCATPQTQAGYGELTPLEPGETFELALAVPDENAASVKVVVQDVLYESPNPLGKDWPDLTKKWKNTSFEQELALARQAR